MTERAVTINVDRSQIAEVRSFRVNRKKLRCVGDYPDLGAVELEPGWYATDLGRGLVKWREPDLMAKGEDDER